MKSNAIRAALHSCRGFLPAAAVLVLVAWGAEGQVTKLLPSVASDASSFGYAMEVDGDHLIVGAPTDSTAEEHAGSAFIYKSIGSRNYSWIEMARLESPSPGISHHFGSDVAIWGDIAAVSAMLDPTNGRAAGAVYVYHRNEGGEDAWGLVQQIVAPVPMEHEWFGMSIAMDESTLVVGGPNGMTDGRMVGALYVYERTGDASEPWAFSTRVSLGSTSLSRALGTSLDLFGDTIVSGDPLAERNEIRTGVAFVFSRNAGGEGNWGLTQTLVPASGGVGDYFGADVSVSAGSIVVGAPKNDDAGFNAGRAYAFSYEDSGSENWRASGPLAFSRASQSDGFGAGVACTSSVMAVVVDNDDLAGPGLGVIALYAPEESVSWRERVVVRPPGESMVTGWGDRLLIHENTMFASAWGVEPPLSSGFAYVYAIGESVLECGADANGDGFVDTSDVTHVIFRYGNMGNPGVPGDANMDGFVNVRDLTHTIFRLGMICPLNQ